MSFAIPMALLVLLALPASVALVAWAARKKARSLGAIAEPHLLGRLVTGRNAMGRRVVLGLWALALVCIALALARPQWGVTETEVVQEGVQIIFAIDVSASMLARDIKPDRLTRAKLEVVDLIDRLDGDAVGLVLFSGAAFVQLPLTTDYVTAKRFLNAAEPATISTPGTVIGRAIEAATEAFDSDTDASRVIVLMTDGEDSVSDPIAAARDAAGSGVTVFTVGFGSPQGEPVPELDSLGDVMGYKLDAAGNRVISRLNDQALRDVADAGNGAYLLPSEMPSLADEIDTLEADRLEARSLTQPIERFQIPLAVALAALVLVELMPHLTAVGGIRGRRQS